MPPRDVPVAAVGFTLLPQAHFQLRDAMLESRTLRLCAVLLIFQQLHQLLKSHHLHLLAFQRDVQFLDRFCLRRNLLVDLNT